MSSKGVGSQGGIAARRAWHAQRDPCARLLLAFLILLCPMPSAQAAVGATVPSAAGVTAAVLLPLCGGTRRLLAVAARLQQTLSGCKGEAR